MIIYELLKYIIKMSVDWLIGAQPKLHKLETWNFKSVFY